MIAPVGILISVSPGEGMDASAVLALFVHSESFLDKITDSAFDSIAARLGSKLGV
jgi:hypothetical protein